jgi:hypothetical protein
LKKWLYKRYFDDLESKRENTYKKTVDKVPSATSTLLSGLSLSSPSVGVRVRVWLDGVEICVYWMIFVNL